MRRPGLESGPAKSTGAPALRLYKVRDVSPDAISGQDQQEFYRWHGKTLEAKVKIGDETVPDQKPRAALELSRAAECVQVAKDTEQEDFATGFR
jgi:hypothetical protein